MHVSPRSLLLVAGLLGTLPVATFAQRLPSNVTPQHYALALTPDLVKATFTGTETIDVLLAAPSSTVTLNAAEITFASVTADAGGSTQTAQVSEDKEKEQVTFTFPKPLPAGHAALHVAYSGILNGMLRGFYLSKTAKRNYAVTQFEPTDARRAFPSFDEPAYKATFDVSLTVDKNDTAISNTNIIDDKPAGAKHTLTFATTPRMSTYLVAFLVGDFVCTKGESDGVPIRACSTPDKLALTPYAVEAAEFVLHYYDTYFGIKYPMPKLDMIAIPDFEAGAMENFGAITYRETDFLVDEKHASVDAKERVAQVVAHEMAHQWFGDMVTMQWWNNLWLNEGFATWMENKPVAAWHPEWNVPLQEADSLDSTLGLDSQAVTRTIRAEANTPDEINEMFDGITYQKGGAILGMVESYLGEEQFRKGVHNYLQAHLFANATAEDFWGTQTRTSGKPVDKIMESFIGQPGVPLLTFSDPAGGKVSVTQSRFFLSPAAQSAHASDPAQTWTVPVCLKDGAAIDKTPDCPLVSTAEGQLPTGGGALFFANARGRGYYRSQYPEAAEKVLVAQVETGLSPAERISLIGDQWAQVRAGKAKVGSALDLAAATKTDGSAEVLSTVVADLRSISARLLATPEEKQAFATWVRATYKPELVKLGMPAAGDDPNRSELRAELFSLVGSLGHDPETIAQAKTLTASYLQSPDAVDPTLGPVALAVAAQNGDSGLFDQLQKTFETDNNPQRAEQALGLLGTFQDPALTERAMAYAASGKVKNQDSLFILAGALGNPATHDAAWKYIQGNWPAVSAQLTEMNGGYIVRSAGSFCSAEKVDEVKEFFTSHPVHASARGLGIAQSQIKDCVEFRTAQESNAKSWLEAHGQ